MAKIDDLFDRAAEAQGQARVIAIRGAREHNLKNVDLTIPRDKLVVFTGLSGSGKSSLAFDTIYAEGQRRYVESLSAYARQFLEMMQKPDVDQIDGLSPAISIEQKTTSKNPRSTVGTVTEIYDYMRLLWARAGIPYSPATGLPIESQTIQQMVDRVLALPEKTRLYLLAPVVRGRKGEYRKEIAEFQKKGFQRLKIDGEFYAIDEAPALDKKYKHDIDVVVDRIVVRPDIGARLSESLETALELADGIAVIEFADAPPPLPACGERPSREATGRGVAAVRAALQPARPLTSGPSPQGGGEKPHPHHLLAALRLPGLGLHHPRDRAQTLLLQQPLRRLPDLRRHRPRDARRRGARGAGRDAHLEARRGRALGALDLALLRPDARKPRQALRLQDRDALGRSPREGPRRDPQRLRRRGHSHGL